MKNYALYIEDDRYSVPTLLFVSAENEEAVHRLTHEKLSEPHHRSIEVREGDRVLFQLVPQAGVRRG